MRLIDAHCHFDFPEFDGRRKAVLEDARSSGLSNLVIPGVRRPDWESRYSRRSAARLAQGESHCIGIRWALLLSRNPSLVCG